MPRLEYWVVLALILASAIASYWLPVAGILAMLALGVLAHLHYLTLHSVQLEEVVARYIKSEFGADWQYMQTRFTQMSDAMVAKGIIQNDNKARFGSGGSQPFSGNRP